jgi:hypothetical protein
MESKQGGETLFKKLDIPFILRPSALPTQEVLTWVPGLAPFQETHSC